MIVTEPVPLFQWSYSADGPGVSYKMSIVEIYPGQHPQEAFETNHPVFEQSGISQTVFLFQQAEGILKPCNEYAVWVEVETSPGLHTSEAGNYSEVISFYWQTSGTSRISLSGPGGVCTGHVDSHPTASEINFQWTATGPFSSFNIIVCPNPCGTYTPGPTTVSVGKPVEGEKITYSGPRHPFGTPELVLKPQPLASEVAEAITGSGIGLNDPVFITPIIQAQENIRPCDPVTYTQTINFAGILEPGAAFTWYVIGSTPNGTTTTSDPYCDRFAPVTTGGGIPDNVACPGCAIKHKTNPGKPISIEFTAPATPVDTTRESPVIPLALLAWDIDDEIQICLCQGNYIEKKISVVDPVKYEWMLEGNGSLATSETPSNLYRPGTLDVGSTASANITIRIKDMKANDPPAFASYDVEVKRINECQYRYTVTRSSTSEGGESTTPTGVAPLCLPQKEEWDPNPPITAFFTDEIHVGVGRRVLLRANGNDADQLKIICSGECGYAEEKIPENDELIYSWIATLGGFPDHGGAALTNSWNTSAIYKAPDTPGDGEIRLKVNDTGQAGDGSLNFVCMLLVGKVDLELEGVADETEDCNGRCLQVNQDDDNGNHVKDLDEKNVEHEDDL
ncbi:MAG TPA: hypothetical protein VJ508_04820, partial [Saprospiraceae bacterium]|nr:hypothetical protein [Saprospiraceae bacterium]